MNKQDIQIDDFITYGNTLSEISQQSFLDSLVSSLEGEPGELTIDILSPYNNAEMTVNTALKFLVLYSSDVSSSYWTYLDYKWRKLSSGGVSPSTQQLPTLASLRGFGMTSDQLSSIRKAAWEQIVPKDSNGNFEPNAKITIMGYIMLPKKVSEASFSIKPMYMCTEPVFTKRAFTATTETVDTSAWKEITYVSAQAHESTRSKVRIGVCTKENINSILIWNFKANRWHDVAVVDALEEFGNTALEISRIPLQAWQQFIGSKLYFVALVSGETNKDFAEFFSVQVDHTDIDYVEPSNGISFYTPDTLWDQYNQTYYLDLNIGNGIPTGEYSLVPIEGVGFDKELEEDQLESDRYWYTTPNGIKLRVFGMSKVMGAKPTRIFECEIINTYADKDLDVSLTMRFGSTPAEAVDGKYCLLADTNQLDFRTKGELSRYSGRNFFPEYPLEFKLGHTKDTRSKMFYFRITPTVTTMGPCRDAHIVAVATEIESRSNSASEES